MKIIECVHCGINEKKYFFEGNYITCKTCLKKSREKYSNKTKSNTLGDIYFIQVENSDGYIKVGYSRDVKERICNGKLTDNPYPIKVLGVGKGNMSQEKQLHDYFKEYSIGGEWFIPTSTIIESANFVNGKPVNDLLVALEAKRQYIYKGITFAIP